MRFLPLWIYVYSMQFKLLHRLGNSKSYWLPIFNSLLQHSISQVKIYFSVLCQHYEVRYPVVVLFVVLKALSITEILLCKVNAHLLSRFVPIILQTASNSIGKIIEANRCAITLHSCISLIDKVNKRNQ